MKLLNFKNWSSGELSKKKLGITLKNKLNWKLGLSKNVGNKKCAPEFVFFNEKNIQEDSDDF